MLNPLVNNTDAAPALTFLFIDIPVETLKEAKEDEDDTQQRLPPAPTKEWMETVYTF